MRIWKQVANTWRGYGNGHKAVIYESIEEQVRVLIYKGDTYMTAVSRPNITSAKRWAEKNYLKGEK